VISSSYGGWHHTSWISTETSDCAPFATPPIPLAKAAARPVSYREELTRSVTEPGLDVMVRACEGNDVLGSAYSLLDQVRTDAGRVGGRSVRWATAPPSNSGMRPAVSLFLILVLCSGCKDPTPRVDILSDIKPDGMPSYEDFARSARYPFVAPEPTRQRITKGLAKAKACITKHEVETLLGRPNWSRPLCPKEPNRKCSVSEWTYILRRNEDSVNMNDVTVQVFFNTSDRATWIAPSNLGEAKDIGGANEKCP